MNNARDGIINTALDWEDATVHLCSVSFPRLFNYFMFVFILLNLCLGFFLNKGSLFYTLLISDISLYAGIFLLLSNVLATWFKYRKISFKLRYDLFAVGALLVWISSWPPFFRFGSPVFQYFPLYFAFITALFSIIFITKGENMDPDAVKLLQWLSDSGRFNPVIIMIAVMISLALPQHFLLFPVTITLLVMRFALASCLNNE